MVPRVMAICFALVFGWTFVVWLGGCSPTAESPVEPNARIDPPTEFASTGIKVEEPVRVKERWAVEDFSLELVQFETVFWDSADTDSLRDLIRTTPLVKHKTVLEIGTGTGLISLCCLTRGASRVVATDINPAAIANARYNARRLDVDDRLETRLVPMDDAAAYEVIDSDEKFDLILSNPPWENQAPQSIDEYAFYDEDFALMRSLLEGLSDHLTNDGKALLAYGNVEAIRTLLRIAPQFNLDTGLLDDRKLDDLPNNFLPGMLIEITVR